MSARGSDGRPFRILPAFREVLYPAAPVKDKPTGPHIRRGREEEYLCETAGLGCIKFGMHIVYMCRNLRSLPQSQE